MIDPMELRGLSSEDVPLDLEKERAAHLERLRKRSDEAVERLRQQDAGRPKRPVRPRGRLGEEASRG